MAKQFDRIGAQHAAFIAKQHIFFTASATASRGGSRPALARSCG